MSKTPGDAGPEKDSEGRAALDRRTAHLESLGLARRDLC